MLEIDEQLVRGQVAVAQQRRIAKEAAQSQYDTPEMKTVSSPRWRVAQLAHDQLITLLHSDAIRPQSRSHA